MPEQRFMPIRKVAIVGSRDFASRRVVEGYIERLPIDSQVISGGATGVDSWAEEAAIKRGMQTQIFTADWKRFGMRAGPLRNAEIVAAADHVVAFWNGMSRGTLNTLAQAHLAGKSIEIHDESGNPLDPATVLNEADRQGIIAEVERWMRSRSSSNVTP